MKNAWYKKMAWCFAILFLLLLCFVAWVGYPGKVIIEDPVEEPPALTLQTAGDSLTVPWTQGRWHYLNWYGHDNQRNKGGTSDQEKRWKVRQPDLITTDGTVTVSFALPPDEVAVACYNVADHSGDVCQVDEEGRFALAEGVWTYRITANWTDETRDYDGTVIYFVCIEKSS